MVFEVELAFFRRDGEEMTDLTWTKGTLSVGSEGTTIQCPVPLAPEVTWMVEIRRGTAGEVSPAPETEMVSA